MKLLLPAFILLASAAFAQTKPTPVIFDTDIGDDIDDALALALALQSPELDVKLVTTVADDVESRTRLAWKELSLFGRQDVALATGAAEPLLDPKYPDQAAQFKVLTPEDQPPASARQRASDRIIETLLASPVKMTVIPVGPLTNIALALKEEPRIKEKIERIVLMGGAYYPPRREYNIYRDRIAAQIVFSSGVPITGVGLDVTEKCKLQGADLERLRKAGNPASQFLYQLIELWQKGNPNQFPTLHDPLAVATAVRPTLVETQSGSVEVEIASPQLFGATVFTPDDRRNVRVAKNVNVREFLDSFVERLSAPPRGK
ncbi:MAG: nucleoside hydrolase [Bryobacteraceae bacterium]|jgi:inosine-uridine nucleoside N-ribohydrolase